MNSQKSPTRLYKKHTALLAKPWIQIDDEKRIDTVPHRYAIMYPVPVPVVKRKENLENYRDSLKAIE
jgi:hypothetical protein